MTESATAPFIFISYARADDELVTRLKTDLQAQRINIWIDQEGIAPGTPDWDEAIREAIRGAHAVLYIASPNARSSRYVRDELTFADMYKRIVYPVWVAGTHWIECIPFGWGATQYIDARQPLYGAALGTIVMTLRKRLSEHSSVPSKALELNFKPRNPYKGLRAFTGEDTQDFFGRDTLIRQLIDTLEKLLTIDKKSKRSARLLAVIGPSGSGKSSMVLSGLLPRLQAGELPGSQAWVYLDPITPGVHPIENLAFALWKKINDKGMKVIREDLEDDSTLGLNLLATFLAKQRGTKVLLFVDQFEELFTQTTSESERQHFIDLLVTAITKPSSPLIVILTLRADFYDRPMQYSQLGELIEVHHRSVLPMEMKELRAVIEEPAKLSDVLLTFEGDLVGDLLFEVREQVGALPLLQFTLDQLFEKREGHLLTLHAYHELGGVKGALAKHAESTYESLPTGEHRTLAHVLFLRLIDPGVTERDTTKRRVPLTELSLPDRIQTELLRETADTFTSARLLTMDRSTLEVSHEALIREWARLAGWLRTNRNDILLQKAISEDAAEWRRRGKPGDRLYAGTELAEAQAWADRNMPNIDELAFLQASMAERERQEVAERVRQKRELDLQRRAARRQQYVIGMMGMTSVVLVVGLIVGLLLQRNLLTTQGNLLMAQSNLLKSLPVSVTNLNDHGPGSLRQAIATATSASAITFAKNLKGTITLTSGELEVTENLAISGPGASSLSISGGNSSRVFKVSNNVGVTISNLTIEKGHTAGFGGGIDNDGTLLLINSTISNNTADYGGGISNEGDLTLTNSTVADNTANKSGGGIDNFGTLALANSTISGNVASKIGGGMANSSSINVHIVYCTIYGNIAQAGGGIAIGTSGEVSLAASIVAGDHATIGPDILGTLVLFLPNLIQNASGTKILFDPHDSHYKLAKRSIIGKSPDIGPLQNKDGPTLIQPLLTGSPAIDQIPPDTFPLCDPNYHITDQRDILRPEGKGCDLGAYEYIPPVQSQK